jgi:predicted NAD/FAD-dependent oxidoreductase
MDTATITAATITPLVFAPCCSVSLHYDSPT